MKCLLPEWENKYLVKKKQINIGSCLLNTLTEDHFKPHVFDFFVISDFAEQLSGTTEGEIVNICHCCSDAELVILVSIYLPAYQPTRDSS